MLSRLTPTLTVARLVTGLLLMVYCLGHFFNHAMGLISIEAMDWARAYFMGFWRAPVLYWVIPAALIIHI